MAADTTTVKLIVRYSGTDTDHFEARIPGILTNVETVPWRSARISVNWPPNCDPNPTMENHARDRLRAYRAFLELCGADGGRHAIAELKLDNNPEQVNLFPLRLGITTIHLIARTPKNVQWDAVRDVSGIWTNINAIPWRTERFSDGESLGAFAGRHIDDGDRVWLELCGPEGERRAVAELTSYKGQVRVMREPSEPGPLKRYDPNGRGSATVHLFKPLQLG